MNAVTVSIYDFGRICCLPMHVSPRTRRHGFGTIGPAVFTCTQQ